MQSRNPSADRVIAWFAVRQANHVARRQLLARGVTEDAIFRRRRSGALTSIHPGVYRAAPAAPATREKEFAAVLAGGPGALLSHRSAADAYGVLRYPAAGEVWITNTSGRGTRRPGLRVLRTRVAQPQDVSFLDWLPITSPARTLLDLAGVVEPERLEAAVAEAQGRRLVREEDLRRQLATAHGRRGAGALRRLLEREAPPKRTKREAELRMLRLIRGAGLPEPLVNATVGAFEVDFYWPSHRVVAEFDSWEFHSDRRAFRRDRERTNDLQLRRIVVLRFTWQHLTARPGMLVARLRAALGIEGFA